MRMIEGTARSMGIEVVGQCISCGRGNPLQTTRRNRTVSYTHLDVYKRQGYENKVKANLEQRIATMGMEDKIFRVLVPIEERVYVKDGKQKRVKRKVFPGYILVEMILDDQSWYVVRHTPGVMGFVGAGNNPIPLSEREVQDIFAKIGKEQMKPALWWMPGFLTDLG